MADGGSATRSLASTGMRIRILLLLASLATLLYTVGAPHEHGG
jgi:hypothetical protein